MTDELTTTERLELINRLIERFDSTRATTANRSAIILSAVAFLLAASSFLIDKTVPDNLPSCYIELIITFIQVAALFSIISLFISAGFAISALGYIWSRSEKTLEVPASERLLYHASSTISEFKKAAGSNPRPADFRKFHDYIISFTPENMLHAASTELWNGINAHSSRYKLMRRSIVFLTLALFSLIAAFIALLSQNFICINI